MAEHSECETRCTKLLPRVSLDSEDKNIYDLQNDIDMQINEIKMEVLDTEYLDEDEETVKSPLKFSIKVEVEEYDELANNDHQLEDDDTTCFTHTKNIADKDLNTVISDDLPENLNVSDSNVESIFAFLFDGNQTDMCLEADLIARTSSNIADNILAREVKNLCSVLNKSQRTQETNLLNVQICNVYKQWKSLCMTSKYYEQPLFYKCYICKKCWWYLGPFMEHAKEHDDVLIIYLETCRPFVCNIVLANNEYEPERFIHTDGDCWRCGEPYSFHEKIKITSMHYKCRGCLKSFYKCKTWHDHEKVCPKISHSVNSIACKICMYKFESHSDLMRHLHSCHIVRSDIFMWSTYKKCPTCKEKYYITCKKCSEILYDFVCKFCSKRFSSKALVDSHISCTQSNIKCKICNIILPKQCMEVKHYIKHTDKFKIVYTCSLCTDVFVFWDKRSLITHHFSRHNNNDVREPRCQLVLMPTTYIEKLKKVESDPAVLAPASDDNMSDAITTVNVYEEDRPTSASDIKEEIIETEVSDGETDSYYIIEENNTTYDELMTNIFQGSETGSELVKTEIKAEILDSDDDGGINVSKDIDDDEESRLVIDVGEPKERADTEEKSKMKKNERVPKIYTCNKCDFQGIHRYYKDHVLRTCLPKRRDVPYVKSNEKKGIPYRCGHCKVTFTSLSGYLRHFTTTHGHKELTCPVCFHDFAEDKLKLASHFSFHVKQMFLKLKVIDLKNMNSAETEYRFECKVCKEIIGDGKFFTHWETHFNVTHSVDEDEAGCSRLTLTVTETTPSNLDVNDLIEKLLTVNSSYNDRTCTLCNRHFHRINDGKRHLIEHLLVDAYRNKTHYGNLRCQICKEDYVKADEYKKHLREHASLPIYQCGLCNKSFSDSSNFVKHKKIHNLKVLICDICKKKYQAKSSLEKHMQMHKEMKPIKCKLCIKIFNTESMYKKHFKSAHEKYKANYKCKMCDLKFLKIKYKWDHMWLVHKERKIKADCPICGKRFRKKLDVRSHLRLEHNIIELNGDSGKKEMSVMKYLKTFYNLQTDTKETLVVCD